MYLLPTPQAKSLPLYLTGIDHQPKEGNMYRKQGLEFHQITFVTQGCGKLLLPSEHRLQEGDFFLLAKNTPHHYTNLSDPMQTFWIVFDGSAADVMMELLCGSEGCYVFAPKNGKMLTAKAESLRRMANTNPNPERLSALLYDILAELLTCKNLHGENADLLRRLAPPSPLWNSTARRRFHWNRLPLRSVCPIRPFANCSARHIKPHPFPT